MILRFKFSTFALLLSLIGVTANTHGDEAGNADHPWDGTFPLKKYKDETPVNSGPDTKVPQVSDLHLVEKETVVQKDQVNPLHSVVRIDFPPEITNIGEAVTALLNPIGYKLLTEGPNTSEILGDLLKSPLPEVQRSFHDVRASEVLHALAGVGFIAVVDHVRRRVTFDPMPLYLRIGGSIASDTNGIGQRSIIPLTQGELLNNTPLVPIHPDDWSAPQTTGFEKEIWKEKTLKKSVLSQDSSLVPDESNQSLDTEFEQDDWKEVPQSKEAPASESGLPHDTSFVPGDSNTNAKAIPENQLSAFDWWIKTESFSKVESVEQAEILLAVAEVFDSSNTVMITSCVMNGEDDSVQRHQESFSKSLIRLGIPSNAIRLFRSDCGSNAKLLISGYSRVLVTRAKA